MDHPWLRRGPDKRVPPKADATSASLRRVGPTRGFLGVLLHNWPNMLKFKGPVAILGKNPRRGFAFKWNSEGLMKNLNRRKALTYLGLFGGGTLVGTVGTGSIPEEPRVASNPSGGSYPVPATSTPESWQWKPIDPLEAARVAYEIYPQGSCSYSVVGGILLTLAKYYGEPYRSFPLHMMRYGRVGIAQWGTVCGVFNGGAAVIGLFHGEVSPTVREALISELGTWYESATLPEFRPEKPEWAETIEPCVAGSVLCHVSVTKWCQATGFDAYTVEKKERCRRISADGARKTAELLNRHAAEARATFTISDGTRQCVSCHGEKELKDIRGLMNCNVCHSTLKPDHPKIELSGQ
jgi:hypothetical protein